jgi:hypothetical protein
VKGFLGYWHSVSVDKQNFLFITSRKVKKPANLYILVGKVDFQKESEVKNAIILGLFYEAV